MHPSDPFDRLRAVFLEAVRRDGEERRSYLDEACGDDAELRAEVEALLDADATPHDALQTVALDGDERQRTADMPDRIAGYRVLGVLGRGGMGIVYRAQQERPHREVALKVLRPEFVNQTLMRRFMLETEVQGTLRHPGIAAVYDAGVFASGYGEVPFFAMELVDGLPLDAFAEQHDLGLEARCRLLAQTCDALQHAHEQGVVHRDLKPGNVLVEGDAQRPSPRILDFGIARVLGGDAAVPMTQTGQLFGTLPYMSPEQLRSADDELDARADVYSLGAMLFELVAGRLPIDVRNRPLTEALHRLLDEDAPPLRSVCSDAPRDLEVVVACALDKDPDRRYPSARAFADDVLRVFDQHPIEARRASAWDRVGKFVQRNRALTAWAAFAFLALLGGLIGVSMLAASNAELARQETAGRKQLRETLYSAQMRAAGPWLLSPDSSAELRRLLAQWPDPDDGDPDLRGFEYELAQAPLQPADRILTFPAHVDQVLWPEPDRMLVFARGALFELPPADPTRRRQRMEQAVRYGAKADARGRIVCHWLDGRIWWRDLLDGATGDFAAKDAKVFALSGDGRWVAWSTPDERLLIHARASGERVYDSGQRRGYNQQMQFAADGEALLVWNGQPPAVELRAPADGALLWRNETNDLWIRYAALSPDGQQIAVAMNDERVYGLRRDNALRQLLRRLRYRIVDMRWSRDGTAAAAATERGEVVVMRGAQSLHLRVPRPNALAFSPNGRTLAVGNADHEVHLFDLARAPIRRVPQLPQQGGPGLAWRGDGRLVIGRDHARMHLHDLATGSSSALAGVWNHDASLCATSEGGRTVLRAPDGEVVTELPFVGRMAWSPNRNELAIASGDRLVVQPVDGAPRSTALQHRTPSLTWSHDGSRIARTRSVGGIEVRGRDGALQLELPDAIGGAVGWSRDDRRLAASSADGVTIYDAGTGDPLRTLQGLTTRADSLDWHPSGERLVAGARHGLQMWDVERGHVVLAIPGWRGEARWSPDGTQLALQPFDPDDAVWVLRAARR